jgi:hypothetical protein
VITKIIQPQSQFIPEDTHLLTFLRGCKFSLEKTKAKFDLYYTIKAACPDWFQNWDPEDQKIKEMLALG